MDELEDSDELELPGGIHHQRDDSDTDSDAYDDIIPAMRRVQFIDVGGRMNSESLRLLANQPQQPPVVEQISNYLFQIIKLTFKNNLCLSFNEVSAEDLNDHIIKHCAHYKWKKIAVYMIPTIQIFERGPWKDYSFQVARPCVMDIRSDITPSIIQLLSYLQTRFRDSRLEHVGFDAPFRISHLHIFIGEFF